MIAAEIKLINLPPNEIITYTGDIVREVYIIDDGYCEVIILIIN